MRFPVLWGDENGTYADFDVGGHKLAMFRRALMAEAIGAENPALKLDQQDYVWFVFAVENVDSEYKNLV